MLQMVNLPEVNYDQQIFRERTEIILNSEHKVVRFRPLRITNQIFKGHKRISSASYVKDQ